MILYSIHVAFLLAVCLLFYKLLLQKETYYGLNRMILLSCLLLSFILPLIPVPQQYSLRSEVVENRILPLPTKNLPATSVTKELESVKSLPVTVEPVASPKPAEKSGFTYDRSKIQEYIINAAFWLYCFGVAIFGINLLVQIVALLYQSYTKPFIKDGIYRIVEIEEDKAPCSFGNSIFINPAKYDWDTYTQILMHEKVHIRQRHTLDLIFAEVMLVVQWFNPFAWIYRKELESNLEFLTDYSVLKNNDLEPSEYQMSLLKVSVPNFAMRVTTNYNQSLLKKRIVMMNARRSNIHIVWKYLMLVPVCVLLVCCLNKTIAVPGHTKLSSFKKHMEEVPVSLVENKTSLPLRRQIKFDTIKATTRKKSDAAIARTIDSNTRQLIPVSRSEYLQAFTNAGVKGLDINSVTGFMNIGISVSYVRSLHDAGFSDLTLNHIQLLQVAGVDAREVKGIIDVLGRQPDVSTILWYQKSGITADYMAGLKEAGVSDLSPNNMYFFKSSGITSDYVNELHKAGLNDLSFNSVRQLQVAGITASFVKSLARAGNTSLTSERIIIASKQVKTAPSENEVKSQAAKSSAGDIEALYASGIPASFIRSFSDIGYDDLSAKTMQTYYSKGITATFVRSFKSVAYRDLSPATMLLFYTKGITSLFIRDFLDIGYDDVTANTMVTFYYGGITANFIRGYKKIPYAYLKPAVMQSFYAKGITADFVRSFVDIGYDDLSPATLESFYKKGITADYVKSIRNSGFNSPTDKQKK